MRKIAIFWAWLGLLGTSWGQSPKEIVLFDGKTLDGWVVEGPANSMVAGGPLPLWYVRDGSLVTSNRVYGFLRYSAREFSDFELTLDYRISPKTAVEKSSGNSGIGIRTCAYDPKSSGKTRPSAFAYEIQIQDDLDKPPDVHSNASIYHHVAPKKNPSKPAGEWNTLVINCVGPKVCITLNGEKVIDFDQTTKDATKSKPLKGYINLQNHGPNREIEFRNLRVLDLESSQSKGKP